MTAPGSEASPWYVCVTKPRLERTAEGNLQDQGYQVFLPLLTQWAQRGTRPGQAPEWQRVDTIMFPRYLFVRPGRPQQAVRPIASTPGISHLVRFGTLMGCLSPQRLEALRSLVAARAQQHPQQPFNPGDSVCFTSGPLKGLQGLVSAVAEQRVMVMMSLLGKDHSLAVPAGQLAVA